MHQSFEAPEENVNTSYANNMSNVQITKQRENATTDKLNVNPLLICEEVCLIFRRLEVVPSLPPPDDFEPSEIQAMKK